MSLEPTAAHRRAPAADSPAADRDGCPTDACCTAPTGAAAVERDATCQRTARLTVLLSFAGLFWMTLEGAVGLYAGARASSVSLIGWALSSVLKGLASIIVIWRLTGDRALSATSERTAQKAVAISFWLLAPYVATQAAHDLLTKTHPGHTRLGIALTATSLLVMPALGKAKHHLGARLGSAATTGEGTQNLLCA